MSSQSIQEQSRFSSIINSTPVIFVVYLLLVTLGEFLVTYTDARLGLLVHILLLSIIVIHTSLVRENAHQTLLLAMVFVPLIRLMSLSLPLEHFEQIYWYLIVSLPIFAIMPSLLKQLGYSWQKVGIVWTSPKIQILTVFSGLILGYVEYFILRPKPFVEDLNLAKLFIPALILFFCTGLFEELIFRGILQQASEKALGKWGALLFSALIFTVLHIGYQSTTDLLFVFAAGAFWGLVFLQTRSIIGTTIAHGITNIMLFLLVPFLFFAPAPERPPGAQPVDISAAEEIVVSPEIEMANLGFIIGVSLLGVSVLGGIAWQAYRRERQDRQARYNEPSIPASKDSP
jgi:uncharacterized protein